LKAGRRIDKAAQNCPARLLVARQRQFHRFPKQRRAESRSPLGTFIVVSRKSLVNAIVLSLSVPTWRLFVPLAGRIAANRTYEQFAPLQRVAYYLSA
jgi:ABC-type transport system involved in cytochrome bd biosynthesis fused ATPase/permease subunit